MVTEMTAAIAKQDHKCLFLARFFTFRKLSYYIKETAECQEELQLLKMQHTLDTPHSIL